jgi:hypothetical protein
MVRAARRPAFETEEQMRATAALLSTALVLAAALATTPAGAIGIPRTSNPGVPWYYPDPNAAATQRFQRVYDVCQANNRRYRETVRIGGVTYTCP